MTFRVRILLLLLGITVLISLAAYLLSSTRLTVAGSGLEDGHLTVETQFPNATCKKVLSGEFPFVRLECDENIEE